MTTTFDTISGVSAITGILFNLRWPRRLSLIVLVLFTQLIFQIGLCDFAYKPLYYMNAGLCDFAAIYLLHRLPNSKLSHDLQCINFLSLITNAVGYFMWLCYLSPTYYNHAMLALLTAQAVRFLWVTDDDQRCLSSDTWSDVVRHPRRNCQTHDS